jgi:hypothetical protein
LFHVNNTRSLIRKRQPQAAPGIIVESLDAEIAAAAVIDDITSQLASCRDDLSLIH